MSNEFFDSTGVLFLEEITPMIKALYDGYKVDADYAGTGRCYIALTQYGGDSSWNTVLESLSKLAISKGIAHEDADSAVDVLTFLAKSFGVQDDERFCNIMKNEDFSGETSLEILYDLAILFDDGHKISGYLTESAWTAKKPFLFGFGGIGFYQGKHYACTFSSDNAGSFGGRINQKLSNGDLNSAAEILKQEVQKLLEGVVCENQRIALKLALSVLLKAN